MSRSYRFSQTSVARNRAQMYDSLGKRSANSGNRIASSFSFFRYPLIVYFLFFLYVLINGFQK